MSLETIAVQLAAHVVVLTALYGLIAVGFAINYSLQRFFDISQGAAFLIGGYIGYQTLAIWNWSFAFSFMAAVVGAGLFGAGVEYSLVRPMRRHQASPLAQFIATLGVLVVVQNLTATLFGSSTKTFGDDLSNSVIVGLLQISEAELVQVGISAPVLIGVIVLVHRTRFGRRARALSQSPLLGAVIGIPSNQVFLVAFVLGSALSGLAGFLYGLNRGIEPSSGLFAVLAAIIAAIVGGVDSIGGAVLGATLLGLLETVGVIVIPGAWKHTVVFTVLILFLVLRPLGLCGRQTRKA